MTLLKKIQMEKNHT